MEIILEFYFASSDKWEGTHPVAPSEFRVENWTGPIPVVGDHIFYALEGEKGNVARKIIRRTFTNFTKKTCNRFACGE